MKCIEALSMYFFDLNPDRLCQSFCAAIFVYDTLISCCDVVLY